jgi:hypothetical protein
MINYIVKGLVRISTTFIICFFTISACSAPISELNPKATTTYPQAEVVFQVTLPSPLEDGKGLYLEILDEVTGLFFNPNRVEMVRSSDTLFFVKVPLTIGSDVNYRYVTISESINVEYNSKGKPIAFRRLFCVGPELVQDRISAWENESYSGALGRIRGQIIDQENQAPIPDLIITAAGLSTTTSSDGTFILENVPLGTHNVVIYSKDGLYSPFQQYAKVDDNASTPIFLGLNKRKMVAITFSVNTPEGFAMRFPLRIAGNLSSLGNPFVTLNAGTGNTSSALPVMEKSSTGKYYLTMNLPSGAYVRYKYTLGDGFWNAELNSTGNFVTRDLIVPSQDTTIRGEIETFESPAVGEISFTLTTPANTPVDDTVFIQLNPYDWMEPIPMVSSSHNKWEYAIYSPTHLLNSTVYRFCRNGDCKNGLQTLTANNSFTPSQNPTPITDVILGWINPLTPSSEVFVENGGIYIPPSIEMINGVELSANYPSTWRNSIEMGLQEIKGTGTNWVILTPRWSITSTNPPMIEPSGSQDLSWVDMQWMINHLNIQGLQPVLFPLVNYSTDMQFWNNATKDNGWWQSYFDRYQRFVLNYADLAELMDVEALIIGDPTVVQHMESSPDSEIRWLQFISDIRARYSGKIIAAISLPAQQEIPGWVSEVDQIYVLFSPNLLNSNNLIESFGQQLDTLVFPIVEKYGKSIIIGINYPSNTNSLTGCVDINGSCLSIAHDTYLVDTAIQAKIINSAIVNSFSRSWVAGFVSREYYPYIKDHGSGPSISGKPAYDVLWFWYHLIQNISP